MYASPVQQQFTSVRYINIKKYHILCAMVETIIEILFFLFCLSTTIAGKHANLSNGQYLVIIIFCCCNCITMLLSIMKFMRDIHFLEAGQIENARYLSFTLINAKPFDMIQFTYAVRIIISFWFFPYVFTGCKNMDPYKCAILKTIGIFPLGIMLLMQLIWMITNKYNFVRIPVNLEQTQTQTTFTAKIIAYLNINPPFEITKEFVQKYEPLECSICLSNFLVNDVVISLGCNHTFHNNCIKKWLKLKETCPTCKQNITDAKNYMVEDV